MMTCGWKGKATRGKALCMYHKVISISLKNIHNDCRYECTPSTVNVHERSKMLAGRSDVSLTVTTPYLWWLCTLLGNSASKVPGHYYASATYTVCLSVFVFICLPFLSCYQTKIRPDFSGNEEGSQVPAQKNKKTIQKPPQLCTTA
jgi:hypothetical protein